MRLEFYPDSSARKYRISACFIKSVNQIRRPDNHRINNYLPRLPDNPGRQQIGLSPIYCPVDAEWIIHHLYYHRKRRI